MRTLILAALLAVTVVAPAAHADDKAAAAVTAYTTADTDIGTLLDDPAARAIVDKHIPGFSSGDQIDMARGMTLRGIQPFAGDTITDEVLAKIDADFAELAKKK